MRDRLVVAFVSLTLAVVAVFLVERAYTTSALIHAQEQRKVERSAAVVAGLLAAVPEKVSPEVLEGVLFVDEHVVYVDAEGRRVEAERHAEGTTEGHDAEDLVATEDVAGGGTVTLSRHVEIVDARVADALLPLVLIALGLVAVAALVALWLANRMAAPFTALAEAAGRLGRGDFAVEVPRFSTPEADSVALALRTSAQDLDALVRRERDFAAHASHELRTPLTATRLELEDLALSAEASPEVVGRVSAALGQLDRLSSTVADLLDASRETLAGPRVEIDLAALVRDTAERWRGLAPTRTLTVEADGVVAVRLPAGALMQVLDVLLANAVVHGEGRIDVTVLEAPEYVEVRVADEGPRSRAAAGMGRPAVGGPGGLVTATSVVESLGGRLRLADGERTVFSAVLPRGRRETVCP